MSGYVLKQAFLHRNRFEGQRDEGTSGSFDILRAVAEINIYESIFVAYLTGSVVIADTSALSSTINFQGQETIRLVWNVGDVEYDRTFYVYGVSAAVRGDNDTSQTYVLQIIEEHAYLSAFKHMRGSSVGNIADIIANTLSSKLDMDMEGVEFEQADQSVRVTENNRTPLELCEWLVERATSLYGEPMFLYSSITGGIAFRSLGTMMMDFPWEENEPFILTSLPAASVAETRRHELNQILTISVPENDDIIAVARSGALKSQYYSVDPFSRSVDTVEFSAIAHFEAKKEAGRTLYPNTMFDDHFDINGTKIVDMDSTFASQINTSGMYDGALAYDEERDPSKHRVKISRTSDLVLLEKDRFDIVVYGDRFGDTAGKVRAVGTTVDLIVPKTQPSYTASSHTVDQKRSGKFLITHMRHIFDPLTDDYTIACTVARIGTPDDINSRTREENEHRPT